MVSVRSQPVSTPPNSLSEPRGAFLGDGGQRERDRDREGYEGRANEHVCSFSVVWRYRTGVKTIFMEPSVT